MAPTRDSATAVRSTARAAPDVRPVAPRRAPLELVPDVGPQRRRRALTRAYTALAVVSSGVGLFLVVFLHVLLAQGQAELDRLDARAADEQAQHDRLKVAVAELESPSRIVTAARDRLRMVPPPSVTFLNAVDPSTPLPPVPTGPVVKPSSPTTAVTTPTTPTSVAGRTTPTTVRPTTAPTTVAKTGTRAGAVTGARR